MSIDLKDMLESFEAVARRRVPLSPYRRFWLRVRKLAVALNWDWLFWFCSRRVWR